MGGWFLAPQDGCKFVACGHPHLNRLSFRRSNLPELVPPAAVEPLAFELAAVVRACGRVGYRSDYVKVKGRFLTLCPISNAKP